MSSDAYEQLANALDRLPSGFPHTSSGAELQILKRIFSPEEAKLASVMTIAMEPVDAIARRAGVPNAQAEQRLKSMLRRGLLIGRRKDDYWTYRLQPYIVGFYEEQWDTIDHELAHLFERYWNEGGLAGIMRYEPALHRVVPAQRAIKTEFILPYDDIKSLILQSKSFEVRDCICRKQQDLLSKRKCSFPLKACMVFLPVERPEGPHSITQKEALRMLDEWEDIGLVHSVSNWVNGVYYACNCCGCCCNILRGITQFGLESSVARANYYAVVDPGACTGCGVCQDRCQVGACKVNDAATIDRKKCIGCGLCVTGCPGEAVSLQLRPNVETVHPPENAKEWEQQRLRSRGPTK